jgi:hypothetical protein
MNGFLVAAMEACRCGVVPNLRHTGAPSLQLASLKLRVIIKVIGN